MDNSKGSPILQVENVNKSFNGIGIKMNVLKNVSFDVNHGEFVIIHGESGSGKSTLLSLLAGFEAADSGSILIDGQNICRMSESGKARFRRKAIGFVFQQYRLLPELTALENVMLPLLIQKVNHHQAQTKAKKMLFYVGLEDRLNHTPEQLSGGQNQRVAIARALVSDPAIIFADEPTGNLDTKNRCEILQLFKRMNVENGTTILMVTHSEEDKKTAGRSIEIKDGMIV